MGRKHYLLAKDIQLIGDGRNVAHKLLGWLSDEYIQEWNQRLCLEPTYAKRSVEVYTNIGMYPAFFQMEAGAKRLCNLAEIVQPTWKYQKEFSTTRMKAQKMRIPLLDATDNSDIFTSVYYAHRVNSNDHEDEIEQLRAMKEHVNIIFVVDHTQSMKKYFAPVAQALNEIMERDYRTKIKVGAVLFKDYVDKPVYRTIKLTSDTRSVANQLLNAASTCGSLDRDHWEAMFEGLNQALDANKMGYSRSESNFIVLIGDAGDHPNRNGCNWNQKVEEIATKMDRLNVNFLGYQINNDGSDAAFDWALQNSRMQKTYSELLNKKVTTSEYEYKLSANRWYELMRIDGKPAIRYITYQYAPKGRNTSENGLKQIVFSNIDKFINYVEKRIEILERNIISDGDDADVNAIKEVLD